jgi:hypothetical protein
VGYVSSGSSAVRVLTAVAVMLASALLCSAARADYYVDDEATHDANFSGSGCGASASASVRIPPKSVGITRVSPSVGDGLQDGVFAEGTVAHVTSVSTARNSDGSVRVTWTATGSDSACNSTTASSSGWSTETVTLRVDYSRDVGSRVYWRSRRNRPRDEIRPRFHSVLADVRFERMRWSRWGGSVTFGVGYIDHDDFVPVGGGRFRLVDQLARATFHLSHVVYCDDGRLIYTHLLVHALQSSDGLNRNSTFNYDCEGGSGVG